MFDTWLFFSSFKFFFYSQPPQEVFIHKASRVNWSLSIWEHLTSFYNKRQRKRDDMTAMRRRWLHFNWWLVGLLCLSSGLGFQNVVGWGVTYHLPSNWNLKYKYFLHKDEDYCGFHQLGPLGRVGLVVTKSVCVFFVCPLPMQFFLRGRIVAERASSVDWCDLDLDLDLE